MGTAVARAIARISRVEIRIGPIPPLRPASAGASNRNDQDRDKIQTLYEVGYGGGAGIIDKAFRQYRGFAPCQQIQGTRQRVTAVADRRDAGRNPRQRQAANRDTLLLFELGGADGYIADGAGIAGNGLDALLVIADDDLWLDLPVPKSEMLQEQLQR
jgi:hypothetical protein